MRINNTLRWARKAGSTATNYHLVADQTTASPRATCNRSYPLDAVDGEGIPVSQVQRSTYGTLCERCRVRAERITAADQASRDADHAEALAMVAEQESVPAVGTRLVYDVTRIDPTDPGNGRVWEVGGIWPDGRIVLITDDGYVREESPGFVAAVFRPVDPRICPVTGDRDCADRGCELHYMSAPLRFAPWCSTGGKHKGRHTRRISRRAI